MITATMVGDDKLIARFEAMPGKVHDRLYAVILKWALKLEGHVKTSKLSGQVLKIRTGTLRRSVTQKVEDSAGSVMGIVGTNVAYAARHEYGFTGEETVKAHDVKAHLRVIKQAFGREMKEPKEVMIRSHTVRSHTRKANYPEHSFLRSAMKDYRDDIASDLKKAVGEAVTA